MARQYQNMIDFISPYGYFIITPKEEYIQLSQEKRVITLECKNNHLMTLVHGVFINKKSKRKNKYG